MTPTLNKQTNNGRKHTQFGKSQISLHRLNAARPHRCRSPPASRVLAQVREQGAPRPRPRPCPIGRSGCTAMWPRLHTPAPCAPDAMLPRRPCAARRSGAPSGSRSAKPSPAAERLQGRAPVGRRRRWVARGKKFYGTGAIKRRWYRSQ
jgi:hypothetical protein